MLALKSGLRFFVSAPEVPFFVTWKRALLAKVPVFRCQKMALRVPRQKNRDHFLMPTSPQNDVQHVCFMHLSLLSGFWANLKKMAFWARFPPLNDQIGKKSTYIGRNGPRAKTKTVMKPVKQWEKLGSMPNLKFKTFLNKNPPIITSRYLSGKHAFIHMSIQLLLHNNYTLHQWCQKIPINLF